MEEETKDGVLNIVEWTIENFRSWNREIHGKVIESPKFLLTYVKKFELYPKGLSGSDEHLEVRILDYSLCGYTFDLLFVGSDGSTLCSMQVSAEEIEGERENRDIDLPPGPKYDDVIAHIAKNEGLHKDRLTLKCQMKDNLNVVSRALTTIKTIDITLKMSTATFSEILEHDHEWSWVSCISFRFDTFYNDLRIGIWVIADENDKSKLGLQIDPNEFYKRDAFFWTCLTVLNNGKSVRTEEKEHIDLDRMKWTVSKSLSMDEVKKEGFSLLFRIKIIPRAEYIHENMGEYEFIRRVNDGMPTFTLGGHFSSIYGKGTQREDSRSALSKDLMSLYQEKDFSDFQLRCGKNVSFATHKDILSARSPVFNRLLSSDMREAATGYVDIEDLDPRTLARFLTFLYTGTVEDLEVENVSMLYYAAEKYQVPTLKIECADVLSKDLSFSNVCDVLLLANTYLDEKLTTDVHKFILENYNDVLRSEEWKRFSKSHPGLALDTLTHFAEKDYVVGNKCTVKSIFLTN